MPSIYDKYKTTTPNIPTPSGSIFDKYKNKPASSPFMSDVKSYLKNATPSSLGGDIAKVGMGIATAPVKAASAISRAQQQEFEQSPYYNNPDISQVPDSIIQEKAQYNPAAYAEQGKRMYDTMTGAINSATNPVQAQAKGIVSSMPSLANAGLTASAGPIAAETMHQVYGTDRNAPINIPYIGQINPNAKSAQQLVGQAAQVGAAGKAYVNPATTTIGNALTGFFGGAGQNLAEGGNWADAMMQGAQSAALGAGLSAISNSVYGQSKATPEGYKSKDIVKQQKNVNLPQAEVEKLQKPSTINKMNKYQMAAQEAVNTGDASKSATMQVSSQTAKGLEKIAQIGKSAGQQIGNIKGEAITQPNNRTINITEARKNLLSDLSQKGVFVDNKGNLNFKGSAFENSKGDQTIIKNIWGKVKQIDAMPEGKALTFREDLQNQLYTGDKTGNISSAKNIAQNFERNITKEVHGNNQQLADADKLFSDISKLTGGVNKVAGSKNELLKGDKNVNLFNLLRRSMGAGNQSNAAIVNKIETYGRKYDIPELKNLKTNLRIAQLADDAAGVDLAARPTSLVGRLGNAGKQVLTGNKLGAVMEIGQGLTQAAQKGQVAKTTQFFNTLGKEGQRIQDYGKGFRNAISPMIGALTYTQSQRNQKLK